MITEQDVYVAYRRAKSLQSGKGFRLPKQWDEFFATKITEKNKECLVKVTGYFNTTWSNINIDNYMTCGCELYKTFSYHMFLNPKILSLYKEKDKQLKRKIRSNITDINNSFGHVSSFLKSYFLREGISPTKYSDYTDLETYCKIKDDNQKIVIADYLRNMIDPVTLTYCLYYKYLKLTDVERYYCYNVTNRYRDFLEEMFLVEAHLKMLDK